MRSRGSHGPRRCCGCCKLEVIASAELVTRLDPMKCGAKYTWVDRNKRKTAASFPDTTNERCTNGCHFKMRHNPNCYGHLYIFISFSWCCSTHFLERYEIWGVTVDCFESSQHWLMRSIIECNFCCLDNLFGTQTKIELRKYNFKDFKTQQNNSDCVFNHGFVSYFKGKSWFPELHLTW